MAGSTTGDATPSTGLGPQAPSLLVHPVEVAHVVVPLDGSPFGLEAVERGFGDDQDLARRAR